MQCCWKKKYRYQVIAVMSLFWLCSFFFWTKMFIESITSDNGYYIIFTPFFLFVYCLMFYFVFMFVIDQREYSVSSYGLTISYLGIIRHHYEWEEFSEIAICKLRYSKKFRWMHLVGIRFVVGPEINGPQYAKQADEPWSTDTYEFRHWRTIITIEFSEERLEELRQICPKEIADYRHLQDPTV